MAEHTSMFILWGVTFVQYIPLELTTFRFVEGS